MEQKQSKGTKHQEYGGMRNWYFSGWELKQQNIGGRKKRTWVYTGPMYTFGLDETAFRKLKKQSTILCAACFLFWIGCLCCRSLGANSWAGFVILLNVIPLFYAVSGLVTLLRTGPEMTLRSARGSSRYLKNSSAALSVLSCLAAAVEIWMLLCYQLPLLSELPFLLLTCADAASAVLLFHIYRHLEAGPVDVRGSENK